MAKRVGQNIKMTSVDELLRVVDLYLKLTQDLRVKLTHL